MLNEREREKNDDFFWNWKENLKKMDERGAEKMGNRIVDMCDKRWKMFKTDSFCFGKRKIGKKSPHSQRVCKWSEHKYG